MTMDGSADVGDGAGPSGGRNELRRSFRSRDWAQTGLGPMAEWPEALRLAATLCMDSDLPLALWWGTGLTQLYNDSYRLIIGAKHPTALGGPARTTWAEIWPVIGPMAEQVFARGRPVFRQDLELVMDRRGFLEQTYFTFSYSPVRDADGVARGMLIAAMDSTAQVLATRRISLLRDLGEALQGADGLQEAAGRALRILRGAVDDLPEVDIVLRSADGTRRVVEPAGPLAVGLADHDHPDGVDADAHLQPGATIGCAVALSGVDRQEVVLLFRLSDRLPADRAYRSFVGTVVRAVTAGLKASMVVEAERGRADAQAALADRLQELVGVAQSLGDAQTEADVLRVVTERGLGVLDAAGATLCLAAGPGQPLRVLTSGFFSTDLSREVALLPVDYPLPMVDCAVTGRVHLLPDRATGVALFPAAEALYVQSRTEAAASLPLWSGERLQGSMSVAWEAPHHFGAADEGLLRTMALLCAQALDRVNALRAERLTATAASRMSEALQRSLLSEPPRVAGIEVEVRYRPAAHEAQVGGDWYDAFVALDGRLVVTIGDVAGHDRDAAAAMAQVRNLLRGLAHTLRQPPAAVLSALDRAMRDLEVGSVATAVLATLEQGEADVARGSHTLRWSNAGHPPPVLISPGGGAVRLGADPVGGPDLLLGLDPTTARFDHVCTVPAGSTVLLYTDGLVERRGSDIEAGIDALCELARGVAEVELDQVCDVLLARLAGAAQDDVAMLALRTPRTSRSDPPA